MKPERDHEQYGLYIHIPFCQQKCHYCDFLSWPHLTEAIPAYVEALVQELKLYRGVLAEKQVSTVFFGGGTPSLLSYQAVNRILDTVKEVGTLSKEAEISLEANPENLTREKIQGYVAGGINRLSMGLQSTHPALLDFLGRKHTAEDFEKSVTWAREAGIDNINGDLIFGIPGQTMKQWQESLSTLASLKMPHLSCYGLTYEENTPLTRSLHAGSFDPVEEDLEWHMFRYGIEWLQGEGYRHYEISNYALPGFECQHNMNYWKNREYLGIGAGAHGFINGERLENQRTMEGYFRQVRAGSLPVIERTPISLLGSISETCFLGLRMREGISEADFQKRYGRSIGEVYQAQLPPLISQGLLERHQGFLRLTERGFDLANQVFEALLLDEKEA